MSTSQQQQSAAGDVIAQAKTKLSFRGSVGRHHGPRRQAYYAYAQDQWREATHTQTNNPNPTTTKKTLHLLTWNIDVLGPFAAPRMHAALNHLRTRVAEVSNPIIIFLQEMCVTDLQQIQAAPWIQQRFHITDISNSAWGSPLYGTTTLVDRRLRIEEVSRMPYVTQFERDGLFVDIQLADSGKVLRLCNTHLESLAADPPIRPLQMEAAARYLREDNVHAGLLAGDLNAIQPFDRTLHAENGLRDAYLELRGKEDSEEGYTWGYQVPEWKQQRFGRSRMDKVLFCGGAEVMALERIGIGVKVEDEEICKQMIERGQLIWVTDHYGLMAEVELMGAELALTV